MISRKDEFRALIQKQLDVLHRRIAELERLAQRVDSGHQHSMSWDTTVSECRKKHIETMRRLHEIDAHDEDSWHETGAHVRDAVEDLEKAVERHENGGE